MSDHPVFAMRPAQYLDQAAHKLRRDVLDTLMGEGDVTHRVSVAVDLIRLHVVKTDKIVEAAKTDV